MITLVSGGTTITLPEDMRWSDEFEPWKVARLHDYSVNGVLIIDESEKQAGRPITLQSGPDFSWVQRSVVEQLRTLASVANGPNMTLSIPDYPSGFRTFTVRFRDPAMDAEQRKHKTPPAPADYYNLVIRLIEVA